MINSFLILILLISTFLTGAVYAFQQPDVISPRPGDVLRGVVEIQGTAAGENLRSYDVAFAYADEVDASWFIISSGQEPVTKGVLAEWDTTSIADGIYRLRVQVFYDSGEPEVIVVENVRVRNYTPVETRTAEPASTKEQTPAFTSSPAPVIPSATPLAQNPMEISQGEFTKSILAGAGMSAAILFFIGLRALVRKSRKGGKL